MITKYYNEYSKFLNKNMEFKVYGDKGKPCLVFPSQNDRFYIYEDKGLINSLAEFIDNGMVQLICVDNYDYESWSATWKNGKDRILSQEAYYNYIMEEIVPFIKTLSNEKIMTFGVSLGAYQAVNFFLRRPDVFDSVLSLSGIYHSGFFFGDYHDELTFLNSPIDSLRLMDINHPYVSQYNKSRIIICVGKGAWEFDCQNDTYQLEQQFRRLGVEASVYYWSEEYIHDWPSWNVQAPFYFKEIL